MDLVDVLNLKDYKKFRLASVTGYTVEVVDKNTGRCIIVGADNYINNDFRNINEVMKIIFTEIKGKGFNLAA